MSELYPSEPKMLPPERMSKNAPEGSRDREVSGDLLTPEIVVGGGGPGPSVESEIAWQKSDGSENRYAQFTNADAPGAFIKTDPNGSEIVSGALSQQAADRVPKVAAQQTRTMAAQQRQLP